MARFLHITAEKNKGAIRRAGLKPARYKGGGQALGVYAMPVLPDYELTYQWAREIRRWGGPTLVGVTFQVPGDEPVFARRFAAHPKRMTASEAVALIHGLDDPRGWEVIIRRRVGPKAIESVRPLRKVVGWRYFPDAHGRKPCGCPACVTRGEPYQAKLRREYEEGWR